jgi:hypothetical protein
VLMHALAASCEELRARTGKPPLGSIVREFYYKQYGENRTMIIKTAPFGI